MSLDFTNEEKVNSPFCKTPEEAVTKDIFLRGFELTLKKIKKYNTEYILGIIKKIQDYKVISIEEFKTLREIINNKEFINTAKQVFTRAIIFSGNIEEINEFKESITIEKLIAYLIEYSVIELLKNETDNILNEEGVGKLLYENNGISFYKTSNIGYIVIDGLITTKYANLDLEYVEEAGLITAEVGGKGKILLNTQGKQVSPDGVYYNNIDLGFVKETGLIIVEILGKGEIILNKDLEQISPEGIFYHEIAIFEDNNFIAAYTMKGAVILDNKGKQISPEGTYYKSIDVSLLYNTGLIIASTKELHYLLDREGNIVNTSKKEFEYDYGENKIFTKGFFRKKTYYPNQD